MAEMDVRIGSELAGYRIESLIGRGGMSVVYLAEHLRLGRKVAFKVLAPELAQEKGFRDRFIRESQLAASIDHPNIVPVHDAGEIDGLLFIAMRYVEGTDLKRRLREVGPLPPDQVVAMVGQVASALDAAHERGLVHRDVKPGNILLASGVGVERTDHVYLADFGLTKQALSVSGVTATGQFVGTIDYVAPEQIRGEPLDGRADVYSLGCVLFESLTGHPPYKRDSEVATLYAHLQESPPSLTVERPDLPVGVDDVVSKAMAKSAADRFGTAGELATAVGRMLPKETRGPVPFAPAPRQRRRLFGLAAAAAAALLIVLAAMLLTRGSGGNLSTGSSGRSGGAPAPPSNSVVHIDPNGKILRTVGSMPPSCARHLLPTIAFGERAAWYRICGRVAHVDETGRTESIISFPFELVGTSRNIVIASRIVWIPSPVGFTSGLTRIDAATDDQLQGITLPGHGAVAAIDAERDTIWAGFGDGTLYRIDARTGRITGRFRVPGAIDDVAVGAGAVWGLDRFGATVFRVNEVTGRVIAQIPVAGDPRDIVAGDEGVWVTDQSVGTITALDADANEAKSPIRVGEHPTGVAAGLGSVWVCDADGVLRKIDPVTRRTTEIDVGTPLASVAIDPRSRTLWLAVASASNVA